MYDIIEKKRNNQKLSKEEIDYWVMGYVNGTIPDYQVASLLMAICFNGLDDEELTDLTMTMASSGDQIDLSQIEGKKVDKHSTGGVGDKTTLIVAPIAAACGCRVAKMSGKGLGFTGGTADKLESIQGYNINIPLEQFIKQVNDIGISLISQSGNLTPADKKIYSLRDVTATVESIPLIASSIMSKKIAAGSDCIVLDVKMGSGAFMKNIETARELSRKMVNIGKLAKRKTMAVITNMDIPLGINIGNSLEVIESIEVLKGKGPKDLRDVSIVLATCMVMCCKGLSEEEAKKEVIEVISNGKAFEKLKEVVKAQRTEM
jgi:pyrimidine-nucleoside phosphorylase